MSYLKHSPEDLSGPYDASVAGRSKEPPQQRTKQPVASYNAQVLDRINKETDADFNAQVKAGLIKILNNFPEDGSACIVARRNGSIVIYVFTTATI
jgi:hypothetical protein